MAFNLFAPQKPQPTGFTSMDQSRWAQLGNEQKAATEKWVNDTKQNLGIGQNTNPEPIVTPFTPGTKVVQQPVVQEQKTTPVQTTQNTQVQQPITSTEDLARAMGYTSPEEEEKMRKASVANQRIMAVADALRQIGNIYNTVHYAPSQQFNSPVEMERQRYQQAKALRDRANQTYISYQQAKEQQEAKQRQWEADYGLKVADAARKAGYTEAQIKNMQDRLAQQKAYQEGQLGLNRGRLEETIRNNKERLAETKRANNARISQGNQRISIAKQNLELRKNRGSGSGGASGVPPLDTPRGQITPNGRNYANQIEQIWSYAKEQNLVKESDVSKRLRELGFGKDQSKDVRHQMVLDLLRTNQSLADYATNRLGWSYGGGTPASNWDEYAEDEDDWNDYLED